MADIVESFIKQAADAAIEAANMVARETLTTEAGASGSSSSSTAAAGSHYGANNGAFFVDQTLASPLSNEAMSAAAFGTAGAAAYTATAILGEERLDAWVYRVVAGVWNFLYAALVRATFDALNTVVDTKRKPSMRQVAIWLVHILFVALVARFVYVLVDHFYWRRKRLAVGFTTTVATSKAVPPTRART